MKSLGLFVLTECTTLPHAACKASVTWWHYYVETPNAAHSATGYVGGTIEKATQEARRALARLRYLEGPQRRRFNQPAMERSFIDGFRTLETDSP